MLSNKPKISICIPVYEQHGKGYSFLNKLLETIKTQTYDNFNVIISDHSINDELKDLCDLYINYFEIIYKKNTKCRGNGSANTNNALKNSDGEIIKIIFQDDFSLEKINDAFQKQNCKWLVSGCNHTDEDVTHFFRQMIPYWNNDIVLGKNTISSPSVLSFLRDSTLEFDENLIMLMDCDFYWNLYIKYGEPYILSDCLISNRFHNTQVSKLYDTSNFEEEIIYIKKKYNIL